MDDETGGRPAFDINEHVYWDCSTRPGEEHLHVVDGLTYADIIEINKEHRPHLFRKPDPIPGMPARYASEHPHVWTLLDHIASDYHRKDAIMALKLLVAEDAHCWIDACAATDNGWKDLRYCRGRTPEMTLAEIPRAAAQWQEELRREAEEKRREAEMRSKPKPEDDGKPSPN